MKRLLFILTVLLFSCEEDKCDCLKIFDGYYVHAVPYRPEIITDCDMAGQTGEYIDQYGNTIKWEIVCK